MIFSKLLPSKSAKIVSAIVAVGLIFVIFKFLESLHMKFFLMFTAVLFIGCSYISLRLVRPTSLRGWKRFLAYVLCYLPMLNMPIRYEVRQISKLGDVVPLWLDVSLFASYILIGSLSVFAVVTMAKDVFLFGKWLVGRRKKTKAAQSQESSPPDISRRLFLQNSLSAGVVVASSAFVGYGLSEAMGMPEVKHIKVPVHNLPKAFHNFNIVQITDLHINSPAPISRLEKIVEKINSLKPDTVVVTGDVSDSYPSHVREEMDPLRHLVAPYGKYFVSGNHEYYTGIEPWLEEVDRLKLINLQNEHRVIERQGKRLLMCGVADINAPRMSAHISSPTLAQEGSNEGDIKVLLAHQPQSIYEAVETDYHLQISGHTHGGQLFPWTYVTDLVQPYIHGLYKVQNTQLYVSRGTGYWGPPLRIGAPPEITFLELIPA